MRINESRIVVSVLAAMLLLSSCSRWLNLSNDARLTSYLALELSAQLDLYEDMHAKSASMESYCLILEQSLQNNIARALYLTSEEHLDSAGMYQLTHMLKRAKTKFKRYPLRIVWLHAGKPFAFPDDPILPQEYLARDAFESYFRAECIAKITN
jgi:hypothetical protein